MSYDLKAFCRDLQDRLNWLFKEVTRLEEENERLQRENKTLREEVTLARLFRDIEPQSATAAPPAPEELFDLPAAVSREALSLYQQLPENFTFAEYFQAAEGEGVSGDLARDYMLLYFREHMLHQLGTRIEKTGDFPYPRRLAR